MEETKANKFAQLEDRRILEEQLRNRNNELDRELNELENEVPVQ